MAQPLKIVIASDLSYERTGMRHALADSADIASIEEIEAPEDLLQLQSDCPFQIVITRM
jgi:hypothetical protein